MPGGTFWNNTGIKDKYICTVTSVDTEMCCPKGKCGCQYFFFYYIYFTPVNNLPLGARKSERFTNIYNEQYN